MGLSLRLAGDIDAPPSDAPDGCLCAAVRMLARLVTSPLERMLAGHGLTLTEFQLMVKLHSAPASAIELALRLRLDPAPVGRSLMRLRERGLAERASRRRFALWSLTEEARLHLEVLDPLWKEMNAVTREALGADLSSRIVCYVDAAPGRRPREHRGWVDD
jgi:DNA-binding MarR family transcriptional regulator